MTIEQAAEIFAECNKQAVETCVECNKQEVDKNEAMTREEAVEWLEAIEEKYIHSGDESFDNKRRQAIHLAIRALEREQQLLEWGYQNITTDFYIGDRLFRVTEIAQ